MPSLSRKCQPRPQSSEESQPLTQCRPWPTIEKPPKKSPPPHAAESCPDHEPSQWLSPSSTALASQICGTSGEVQVVIGIRQRLGRRKRQHSPPISVIIDSRILDVRYLVKHNAELVVAPERAGSPGELEEGIAQPKAGAVGVAKRPLATVV